MKNILKVSVIIPMLNEESSIGQVLDAIPKDPVAEIICVDNGCTDNSVKIARSKGARIVRESRRGYGAACWAGVKSVSYPDIVVFLDGDFSDYPEEMPRLIEPIQYGLADIVIGSRIMGTREPGALPAHSLLGNWVAARLLRGLFGANCTDLGPFRAIKYDWLIALEMQDRRFGWTMEMQAKAAARGYKMVEVSVSYRRRIGKSKITGTLVGSVRAGYMIVSTCLKIALQERLIPSLRQMS